MKQIEDKAAEEEPRVGILWFVNGNLLIQSTPLSKAETYGDFLIQAESHESVWEQYQQTGIVPGEMEYDELPRGRVMYDTKTRRFTLLADRCIVRNKKIVRKIKQRMHLPKNTTIETDRHYRCLVCLQDRSD